MDNIQIVCVTFVRFGNASSGYDWETFNEDNDRDNDTIVIGERHITLAV